MAKTNKEGLVFSEELYSDSLNSITKIKKITKQINDENIKTQRELDKLEKDREARAERINAIQKLEREKAIEEEHNARIAHITSEAKLQQALNDKTWRESQKKAAKSQAFADINNQAIAYEKSKLQAEEKIRLLTDKEAEDAIRYQSKLRLLEEQKLSEKKKQDELSIVQQVTQAKLDSEFKLNKEQTQQDLDRQRAQAALDIARINQADREKEKKEGKKRKKDKELSEKQEARAEKQKARQEKRAQKGIDKRVKLAANSRSSHERLDRVAAAGKETEDQLRSVFAKDPNMTLDDRRKALYEATHNAAGGIDIGKLTTALGNMVSALNGDIEKIARTKSAIDTRLQGTRFDYSKNINWGSDSYWEKISTDITGAAGVSPFVTQESIVEKVKDYIGQGINFNVEQRAFLDVIKDKIATTFDAADSTLLRLVRIQQQDSTAARLGMESMITGFLNNMYETTEYLKGVATNVRSSLTEAMALQNAKDAVGFEYTVQKWMGSYFSLGMSDSAVQSIAANLGKIAAGQIEGITGGGTGNLLVMAANQANLPLDVILANGLDESSTNKLLEGMSKYLKEITDMSSDNLVVQQQIASVYGMTASDLRAITNLYSDNGSTVNSIYNSSGNYEQAMGQLMSMAGSMGSRMSMGEKFENAFSNFKYTMASGIATNPVTYSIFKLGKGLKDFTGGISFPAINVFGNGIDLETTVADLMMVGALSGGLLKGIGSMISTGGGGGITGKMLLQGFGIKDTSKISSVSRGSSGGLGSIKSGNGTSESGVAGNENGNDIKDKTIKDAKDDGDNQLTEAKDENEEATTTMINDNLISILSVLKNVTSGVSQMHVKVDDYGLTGWN